MANSKQKTVSFTYVPSTFVADMNTMLDTQAALGFILQGEPKIHNTSGTTNTVVCNFVHQNYVAAGVPNSLGALRKVTQIIGHADLTDADTSQDIGIDDLPSNAIPVAVEAYLATEFSGGTASACVIEIGDTGDPNGLMTSTNVFTGAGVGFKHAPGAEISTQTRKSSWAPFVRFTATDDNVVDLAAGEIHVTFHYIELETPAL